MNKKFATFLDEVYTSIESLKDDCDIIFFRGHSDDSFELLPTLQRSKIIDLEYVENSLFYDFVSMAGSQIKNDNSWEVLFNMRHHGIPTRLLDWSTSFSVALYFAINSKSLNKPHIWLLNPYNLADKNSKFVSGLVNPYYDLKNDYVELFVNKHDHADVIQPEYPVVLYPPRNNPRIFAQQGVFTMHGTKNEKLESLASDCLLKIEVPEDCIEEAKKFLTLSGIHEYSIYPDFDGLANYLTKKHGF